MPEGRSYSEAEAAAQLPGRPHARTLRRWRKGGKVPYCCTPGGRIYYTFEQVVLIGAAMKVQPAKPEDHGRACPPVAADVPESPDMPGELREAAE